MVVYILVIMCVRNCCSGLMQCHAFPKQFRRGDAPELRQSPAGCSLALWVHKRCNDELDVARAFVKYVRNVDKSEAIFRFHGEGTILMTRNIVADQLIGMTCQACDLGAPPPFERIRERGGN